MDVTAILTLLQYDEDLAELLPGGIYDALEISRQDTPEAFDENGELQPCALVKSGNETSMEAVTAAVRTPVSIYLYQRRGYAEIEQATGIIFALLHRQHFGSESIWEVRFNTEIARTRDDALDCSLAVQRYDVVRIKS